VEQGLVDAMVLCYEIGQISAGNLEADRKDWQFLFAQDLEPKRF